MIPWEELNLGERPKLAEKSLHYYVHHALNQPHFVDAGEWMLYTMVKQGVMEQKGETYRFYKMTPARRCQLQTIPRAVQSMYNLSFAYDEAFQTEEGTMLSLETIDSVLKALNKVEGTKWLGKQTLTA